MGMDSVISLQRKDCIVTPRDARILLTVCLVAVLCLAAYLLLSQIAAGAYDTLATERAAVAGTMKVYLLPQIC